MEAKIDIISRELIKPLSPTPFEKKEHKLSFLDQIQQPYSIPLLFFYKNLKPSDSEKTNIDHSSEVTRRLKQSLSDSLTKFYLLGGKLNPDDHFRSVDCDDSGAIFVEAKVDASLSKSFHNAPYESFVQFLPFEPFIDIADLGKPLLDSTSKKNEILFGVQITWFECGGNIIGVCISHKVADLMSLITFMNSWAALNRGETTSKKLVTPNFDVGRRLFPQLDHVQKVAPTVSTKFSWKRFLFNKKKLTEMKHIAASAVIKDPTRVEVVTAFLWNQLINVERVKNQGDTIEILSRMWHIVNLRSRIGSFVSSSSSSSNDDEEFPFGNFLLPTYVSFISKESIQEEDKADYYGDLVRLTSDAIRKVNGDYVLNRLVPFYKNWVTNGIQESQTALKKPVIMNTVFSSWCRFPTYEVDFGWGKPVSVCPAFGSKINGAIVLNSTRDEQGIEAWIPVMEDEFALLPQELLSLVTTNFVDL